MRAGQGKHQTRFETRFSELNLKKILDKKVLSEARSEISGTLLFFRFHSHFVFRVVICVHLSVR